MPVGRTLIEELFDELWHELDTIVDHLMSEGEPQPTGHDIYDHDLEAAKEYGEWRGQAQGVAYALAMLKNPKAPDVEAVREEAMRRWEEGEDQ